MFAALVLVPTTKAQGETVVRVFPQSTSFGSGNVVGQNFSVAVVVEDVSDLYAFDVEFSWNTTYLSYLSHTGTFPKEDYPTPIDPSPYAGILWEGENNLLVLEDTVDEVAGTYSAAASPLGVPPSFNDNATVFVMTFEVIDQPAEGEADVVLDLDIVSVALSDPSAVEIPSTILDGTVTIPAIPFVYPPLPLIKIMPESIADVPQGTYFPVDVHLMGEGGGDLDEFWDVAGFDVYVNYNTTLLEATDLTVDPDDWFASFYPFNLSIAEDINNTIGIVHAAFLGYGEPHTPPSGSGRLFSITFQSIYESDTLPLPSEPIYLENPTTFIGSATLDSIGGLIDTADPVGTEWFNLTPGFGDNVPFQLTAWDDNGDGVLGPSDQVMLEGADGFYFDYQVEVVTGTLNLTQLPFQTVDEDWLAMDGPVNKYTPWLKLWETGASASGLGNPYMTGNFSLTYPVVSVNYFEVNPQIGAPYNLTEGVDFIVNPDGTIDLLTVLDERVENEYIGAMPFGGNAGWPPIQYTASGFESVWINMTNGTSRYAIHTGVENPPPNEYWYDDWFPYELESWWATGYYAGSWVWPDGTDVYINYSAAAFVTIDYNALPDPNLRYIEFNGTYSDFLAALAVPTDSTWDESYPVSTRDYTIIGWTDIDTSSTLTPGDLIDTVGDEGSRQYVVNNMSTDIVVSKKPWLCNNDPSDMFFGVESIVTLAGLPHPDRAMCPWHYRGYSVPLPHVVEDGTYTAKLSQAPPVANFTISVAEPREGDLITFDATNSYDPDGTIEDYYWDFGDETNTTGITTTHAYSLAGIYTVTLTVTDNASLTGTYFQQITVRAALTLSLTPDTGFASTTITGTGFDPNSNITVTWNGTWIPTVPHQLVTDENGAFTAIISVLTPNEPGDHIVEASDDFGNTAQATFAVVDMTGPAGADGADGADGAAGPTGPQGPEGPTGQAGPAELLWASLILAIIALLMAIYVFWKKS